MFLEFVRGLIRIASCYWAILVIPALEKFWTASMLYGFWYVSLLMLCIIILKSLKSANKRSYTKVWWYIRLQLRVVNFPVLPSLSIKLVVGIFMLTLTYVTFSFFILQLFDGHKMLLFSFFWWDSCTWKIAILKSQW